jgi:uncharacterized protein YeaO (DUF488 family)
MLKTFQIGAPKKRGEGIRIGATRRPPRGVPRVRWKSDGYFDVWLPTVAPSESLRRRLRTRSIGKWFFDAYEREMAKTNARQTILLLAEIAGHTPIAIGCRCEDETMCHRSRLRRLIEKAASMK